MAETQPKSHKISIILHRMYLGGVDGEGAEGVGGGLGKVNGI